MTLKIQYLRFICENTSRNEGLLSYCWNKIKLKGTIKGN